MKGQQGQNHIDIIWMCFCGWTVLPLGVPYCQIPCRVPVPPAHKNVLEIKQRKEKIGKQHVYMPIYGLYTSLHPPQAFPPALYNNLYSVRMCVYIYRDRPCACIHTPPHAVWLAGPGVCGERARPEFSASPLPSGLWSDTQPAQETTHNETCSHSHDKCGSSDRITPVLRTVQFQPDHAGRTNARCERGLPFRPNWMTSLIYWNLQICFVFKNKSLIWNNSFGNCGEMKFMHALELNAI